VEDPHNGTGMAISAMTPAPDNVLCRVTRKIVGMLHGHDLTYNQGALAEGAAATDKSAVISRISRQRHQGDEICLNPISDIQRTICASI
jgi:hypothetical protein